MLFIADWLSRAVPPRPARSKCTKISGTVTTIERSADTHDIIIGLENGGGNTYYINRGVELIPDGNTLDSIIQNRRAMISYYDGGWNLFGNGTTRHICEIVVNNKVVYTEFDDL
ncbi:MAG: hypothetical protein EOP56_05645 [Sphingobacteriales bacterium]|nr:MAG: hypothetical protein EOP56_05645 [Sphingobacteriales bacterium]